MPQNDKIHIKNRPRAEKSVRGLFELPKGLAATAATAVTVAVTSATVVTTAAVVIRRKQDDDNDKDQKTVVTETTAEIHSCSSFPLRGVKAVCGVCPAFRAFTTILCRGKKTVHNFTRLCIHYRKHNHSARVRTRFSRQYFRLCFVKILVNPKGLTAVLPRRDKNPAPENSPTQKTRIAVQFWTQNAKQG